MSGGRKTKTRSVRRTALIYCEGAHDLAFIRHLIKMYNVAGKTNIRIRAKQGDGGAHDVLVIEANNVLGGFDRRAVKLDRDRTHDEVKKAERISKKLNIELIWSVPCIEALLLGILENKNFSGYKSKTCKKRFEKQYVASDKRTDSRAYEGLFSLEIIEDARKRLPELDTLIRFITS
jgi:hypothetical protein